MLINPNVNGHVQARILLGPVPPRGDAQLQAGTVRRGQSSDKLIDVKDERGQEYQNLKRADEYFVAFKKLVVEFITEKLDA